MGLSTEGERLVLTELLTGRFVSMHTADPGNTGANEVSTGGGSAYARQAATFVEVGANPMVFENDGVIEYPVAATVWGTLTHFGVWSLVAGGTFLGGYALAASKLIEVDDVARFRDGELEIGTD